MNQTAIVFGAGGQLGVELVTAFRASGYDVEALTRASADITNDAAVRRYMSELRPSLVVNAAAYNLVDLAESEAEVAFSVNALAVRNLARACADSGAKLVHYSTDYVFDGTKGSPYGEEDAPLPLGSYAVSKLAGEFFARAYAANSLIIRTCGVFGPGGRETARGNFVETMLRLAASGKPIRVISDSVASPAYAPAMADRTVQLVERDARGVIHMGGGEPVSWFDYAKLVFEAAGLHPDLSPVQGSEHKTPARRPKYSALSNAKMESLGVTPMPPLREALAGYFQAINRMTLNV